MNLYLLRLVTAFIILLLSSNSQAGLLYNLSWNSTGSSPGSSFYEVTGTIELSPTIAVGSTFVTNDLTSDIMSMNLSFFVDGIFEGTGVFPTERFSAFRGTRLGSSLSFTEFFIGKVVGTNNGFGCRFEDCIEGQVDIPRPSGAVDTLTFASQAAARASFVATAVTAVPSPSTLALMGLGFVSVGYRTRLSRA
ncbi:MAG: hypothetical protein AAGI88_03350 [Pseudomonadota bacterium]